jgi:type IV pilus assembly protein PilY1
VQFVPTGGDGTIAGCPCEGWGAGVSGGTFDGVTGFADQSTGVGGLFNVTFSSDATTATSTVTLRQGGTDVMQVTQFYHPSSVANLYQVDVTLKNLTGDVLGAGSDGIRYRRLMDWDIPPTQFDEFVTIQGWPADNLLATTDDGFQGADPFSSRGGLSCPSNANFADCGPDDHGALFDFGFNALDAGASRTLTIFYGAATDKTNALAALSAVGAEVYSLGNCDPASDRSCTSSGEPNTFIFGFQGVGGTPVPPPTSTAPEPGTLLLLGSGVMGLVGMKRRRRLALAAAAARPAGQLL